MFTPTDPAFVTANEAQLQQVILNLVTNAAEAISGSGTVSVRVCEREYVTVSEFPDAVFGAPLTAGHYHLISVSDSGSGMTRDVIEQMFNPCFTTKTRGHAFGLSTVLGIVRSHHSALNVVSSPGQGTTITLLIRRGAPPEKARVSEQLRPADAHISSPARTVLVIDDQAMVRRPLAAMLRLRGWHVIEADSGEAAVLELQRRNDFSVIIIDFLMPGMNGQETLNAIRSPGCITPAILCSGCPAAETNDDRNLTFAGFLPGPFRKEQPESLLDTVLSQ